MPRVIAIDRSGRLVIPKEVRNRHRLVPGSRMRLEEEEDRLILVPEHGEAEAVEKGGLLVFRGRLEGAIPDHRALREERLDGLGREG